MILLRLFYIVVVVKCLFSLSTLSLNINTIIHENCPLFSEVISLFKSASSNAFLFDTWLKGKKTLRLSDFSE